MRSRARQGGYSLVEVLISLGILAGVIVAIASMFVLAGTNVKSGKLMTEATSIGQDILEDVNKLSYNGLQIFFVGTQNLSTLTVYNADTRTTSSYANTQYQANIANRLYNGYAIITLLPIGGPIKPAVWNTGEAIRVSVTVNWTELRRNRSVTIESVRF
jgi:type II secretory pathway pseudopilin PulG